MKHNEMALKWDEFLPGQQGRGVYFICSIIDLSKSAYMFMDHCLINGLLKL